MSGETDKLIQELRQFAKDRDWSKFHSPKNLVMALSVECSELLEHFQWMSESDSKKLTPPQKLEVAKEISDVFLYLLMLSDHLGVDLLQSAKEKLQENAAKYPVEKSYGSSKKYSEL